VREFFAPELFNRIDKVVALTALTPEVARAVAAKELGKLTARRGLVDRQRLRHSLARRARPRGVRGLPRRRRRALAQALPRRPHRVAAHRHLVTAPPAELQLVRLHATDDGLSLEIDALSEAPGSPDRFPLLDLADAPLSALRAKLPEALAEVDAVLSSPELQSLADEVTARLDAVRAAGAGADPEGVLVTLDQLRGEVTAFRAELEALARAATATEDWEIRAMELFAREHSPAAQRTVSVFSRRSVAGEAPPLRDAILEALARAGALRRQVSLARDPAQHEVIVHLQRAPGSGPRSSAEEHGTFFTQLRVAYLRAFGEVTEFAAHLDTPMELGPTRVTSPLRDVDLVTLRVVGPGVRDALSLEHGTHIWHRAADAPEVVRVVVEPLAPGVTALAALATRVASRQARDEQARRGGAIAPDALPVVRTVRFTPSSRRGESSRWSVEDFVLGYARETSATELTAPLRELFTLRSARVTPG
jgi:ATP-dependent Clp protease ATP-binding subunit ClpC